MSGIEIRTFDTADEVRPFVDEKGYVALLEVQGKTVGKGVFEPGWRWSVNVKPIAGTHSCEFPHFMYILSGRMRVTMDDGTVADLGPGDVASIAPGHDAETIGDEPCVTLDLADDDADYAKPS